MFALTMGERATPAKGGKTAPRSEMPFAWHSHWQWRGHLRPTARSANARRCVTKEGALKRILTSFSLT